VVARATEKSGSGLEEPSALANVSIRGATRADAARLAELSEVLGYPVTADALAERLGRLLGRDGELVLVAEVMPGHVVGWLHGAEQELLESGRRCEILGLVVDGTPRGRGVGRRLVQAVEAWASTRGLAQMAVRSNVARAESHPFYERLGYVRAKTQHAYRKRLSAPGSV
jgi:GNAT superfamily N-acetyltransferase